ncbi:MAG: carboxypeptidase-like regulatory domain-containing protein [Terriglobales bacterium]
MKKMQQLVWGLGLVFLFALFPPFATAGIETIEYEKVQVVGSLSGKVTDMTGAPFPGATVKEVSPDWETVLQSTKTDDVGHFSMTPQSKTKIHYLIFTYPLCNPLRVRVKIDKKSNKQLDFKLGNST